MSIWENANTQSYRVFFETDIEFEELKSETMRTLEYITISWYLVVNFCVLGQWSSWTKCASPGEVVAWTCGTKWREVIIVICYLEVLSYTDHCCYAVHGVCCYLPVLRTCKFRKCLCFNACISIIMCHMSKIVSSHSITLKMSCHVVW